MLEHTVREERYEFVRLRATQPTEVLVQLVEQVRAVQSNLAAGMA